MFLLKFSLSRKAFIPGYLVSANTLGYFHIPEVCLVIPLILIVLV